MIKQKEVTEVSWDTARDPALFPPPRIKPSNGNIPKAPHEPDSNFFRSAALSHSLEGESPPLPPPSSPWGQRPGSRPAGAHGSAAPPRGRVACGPRAPPGALGLTGEPAGAARPSPHLLSPPGPADVRGAEARRRPLGARRAGRARRGSSRGSGLRRRCVRFPYLWRRLSRRPPSPWQQPRPGRRGPGAAGPGPLMPPCLRRWPERRLPPCTATAPPRKSPPPARCHGDRDGAGRARRGGGYLPPFRLPASRTSHHGIFKALVHFFKPLMA